MRVPYFALNDIVGLANFIIMDIQYKENGG